MTRWARWLVALPLLVGCAGRTNASRGPVSATDIGPDRTPSAARIYTIGEEQFAAGHYHEAVELWRHAVLALPTTADFDDLRHQLILRLAYGQLMAWSASGNPGYLEDAQQMLERYAQRHGAIFGEIDDASARMRMPTSAWCEDGPRMELPVSEPRPTVPKLAATVKLGLIFISAS